MNISTDEMETTISFTRNGRHAEIYTDDTMMFTKLDKLVEKSPNMWSVKSVDKVDGRIVAKTYLCEDKSLISFRTAKVKKDLTEEQRAAIGNRLKTSRNGQP